MIAMSFVNQLPYPSNERALTQQFLHLAPNNSLVQTVSLHSKPGFFSPIETDKYAWRLRQPFLQVCKKNSVFSNMSQDFMSFVTWLYATTLIRDSIAGESLSSEVSYFYALSLRSIQEAINSTDSKYTDAFIRSLACLTACSVRYHLFSSMLERLMLAWLGSDRDPQIEVICGWLTVDSSRLVVCSRKQRCTAVPCSKR